MNCPQSFLSNIDANFSIFFHRSLSPSSWVEGYCCLKGTISITMLIGGAELPITSLSMSTSVRKTRQPAGGGGCTPRTELFLKTYLIIRLKELNYLTGQDISMKHRGEHFRVKGQDFLSVNPFQCRSLGTCTMRHEGWKAPSKLGFSDLCRLKRPTSPHSCGPIEAPFVPLLIWPSKLLRKADFSSPPQDILWCTTGLQQNQMQTSHSHGILGMKTSLKQKGLL